VFGWYDNEWGYSCRLVDVVSKLLWACGCRAPSSTPRSGGRPSSSARTWTCRSRTAGSRTTRGSGHRCPRSGSCSSEVRPAPW